jgi:DNA-binding XRE family transcriptional regulator
MVRIFHIVNKKDENYVYYLVVKNLKKRRKLKGLTQREFADVLDIDIRELFKPINDDK